MAGRYHVRAAGGTPPVAGGGFPGSPRVGAVGGVLFGAAAPVEITVGDTDVTGIRIVVPIRR